MLLSLKSLHCVNLDRYGSGFWVRECGKAGRKTWPQGQSCLSVENWPLQCYQNAPISVPWLSIQRVSYGFETAVERLLRLGMR